MDLESSHSDGFSHYALQIVSVSDGSGFVSTLSVLTATLTPDANSTAKYTLNDGELGYGSVYRFGALGVNSLTQNYLNGDIAITGAVTVVGIVDGLRVKGLSDSAITFDWNAVSDRYPSVIVYEDGVPELTATVSSPIYTVSDLSAGDDVTLSVVGQYANLTSSAAVITARAMRAPSNLSVAIGDGVATITFASDGLSVLVEQVSLGTLNITSTVTSALAQRYVASGLNNGSEYAFRVAGFAHGVATPYSAVTNLVPMATPTLELIHHHPRSTTSISWAAIAGADKYVLERKADSGSFTVVSPLIAGSNTTYKDINLAYKVTTYFYRLRARNKYSQDTGYSNVVVGAQELLLTAATVTVGDTPSSNNPNCNGDDCVDDAAAP